MVDETRQDPIEVEATADVAGDPMEGLGPMQLVGHLVTTPRDRDDRPDGVGDDRRHVAVARLHVACHVADEMQHAPRAAERRDDDREFGSLARQDRERSAQPVATGRGSAAALVRRIVGIGGGRECGPQHAERPGTIDEPLCPGVAGPRRRVRDEAFVAQLPDRDEIVVVCVADEGGRLGEVLVELVGLGGQSGDGIDQRQVDGMSRGGEGIRRRSRPVQRPPIRGRPGQMTAAPASGTGHARSARRVARPEFGRREESLQVPEAIPAVAARVDPVIAQSTGVAPGPDRVRVHPQQAGSLGDGQGRIDRS